MAAMVAVLLAMTVSLINTRVVSIKQERQFKVPSNVRSTTA
jgi:hypothetical protein